jgi:hypothetical protein
MRTGSVEKTWLQQVSNTWEHAREKLRFKQHWMRVLPSHTKNAATFRNRIAVSLATVKN